MIYFQFINLDKYLLPCLNKQILGIECMGCGMQRSFILLLNGKFSSAFLMYPAIFPLLLLLLFIFANILFKFKKSNKIITLLAITTLVFIVGGYLIKLTNL